MGALKALMAADEFGDNPIAQGQYPGYFYAVRRVFPPVGGAYGVNAGVFFALLLASFAYLNRERRVRRSLAQTVSLEAFVVSLFESALFIWGPQWRGTFVVLAQVGTPLQWFTNTDLLVMALAVLGATQGILLRSWHRPTA